MSGGMGSVYPQGMEGIIIFVQSQTQIRLTGCHMLTIG